MTSERLSIEVVAVLVLATWALVGVFWAAITRWERTGHTEARRREREAAEASYQSSVWVNVWRVMANLALVVIPVLFAFDGLVHRIGILYAPSFSFFAGPDLVLQITGIVLSAVGLAILIGVGRKLAVNVYRLAVSERKMMTTGVHRYVRHPFYIQFVIVPVGSFLVTLNYLALLLLVAYTTLWAKPITSYMREEEDDLRRRYGQAADEYLARTGRVLPRLRRPS